MNWINRSDFEAIKAQYKYYEGRWAYYSEAIALAKELNPSSVLEAGSFKLPLAKNSDTIDIEAGNNPTFIHDLRITPWPVEDKRYDLFIALQVWEHLDFKQKEAFDEVARVAKNAIISVPYQWSDADSHDHTDIGIGLVERWVGYRPWKKIIIAPPRTHKRAIFLFKFDN